MAESRVHRASLGSPPVRVDAGETLFVAADPRKTAVAQLSLSSQETTTQREADLAVFVANPEQTDASSVLAAAWLAIDAALKVARRFTLKRTVGLDSALLDKLGGPVQDVAKHVQLDPLADPTAHLPRPYEETETKLASNGHRVVQHPVRPSKPVAALRPARSSSPSSSSSPSPGTLYSRYISHLDEFFCLDPLSADHLDLMHGWLNDPRVDAFWQDAGSLEDHKKFIQGRLEDKHTLAVVGSYVRATPTAAEGETPTSPEPDPATCKSWKKASFFHATVLSITIGFPRDSNRRERADRVTFQTLKFTGP
jgi:hypothetical protein